MDRLFRIKKIELQLVQDRGYNIDNAKLITKDGKNNGKIDYSNILNYTYNDFIDFANKQDYFVERSEYSSIYKNDDKDILLVYYVSGKNNQTPKTDDLPKWAIHNNIKNIIMIVPNDMNMSNVNSFLKTIRNHDIQVFEDNQLAFNPTKHSLSPLNIKIIRKKDVKEWEDNEKIKSNKLPIIQTDDIISKWYNLKSGDVIQSLIIGITANKNIMYRIVR